MRRNLSIAARAVYRRTPLPYALKLRLKGLVYTVCEPMLAHTVSYWAWKGNQQNRKNGKTSTRKALRSDFNAKSCLEGFSCNMDEALSTCIPLENFWSDFINRLYPNFRDGRIYLACHSKGNYFFNEIGVLLAEALNAIGFSAVLVDETHRDWDPRTPPIIIAPHEFFTLEGTGRLAKDDFLARSVLLNTEQWQTQWFGKALPYLQKAGWVLDINIQSAAGFCSLGYRASYLPLGYLEGFELYAPPAVLPDTRALLGLPERVRRAPVEGQVWRDRPIDVAFIGSLNSRRSQALARLAPSLSERRCYLHLPTPDEPYVVGETADLDTKAVAGLLARSKILLNIHQDEVPYFEWHRIVLLGFWQGCLVLSEPSFSVPEFNEETHFKAAPLDKWPALLNHYLETDSGQREAATTAAAANLWLRETVVLKETLARAFHRKAGHED